MAGIPLLAAVGAPSSLAVATALRFGMTLAPASCAADASTSIPPPIASPRDHLYFPQFPTISPTTVLPTRHAASSAGKYPTYCRPLFRDKFCAALIPGRRLIEVARRA